MGRKRKPRSPRAVEAAVREYLHSCEEGGRLPTVAGLALSLGFTSRGEMERYAAAQGKPFSAQLDWARTLIEEETIQAACRKETATGARFLLQSSFGYGEKELPAPDEITVRVDGEEG